MPEQADKTQISLRVPTAVVVSFERIAQALERDRTWVMLRAFDRFLSEEGADVLREAEGMAALEKGEGLDFDVVLEEADAIIARVKSERHGNVD